MKTTMWPCETTETTNGRARSCDGCWRELLGTLKRLYKAQGNLDTKELLGHSDEKTAALYADPRGSEAIRVTVKPLDPNRQQVNGK